jgi:hypothetical protein
VKLNGASLEVPADHKGWVTIDRAWRGGDVITLELPMKIGVREWDRVGGTQYVQRGPLTYSLQIGGRWEPYKTASENWQAFEVYPTTAWNYALDNARPLVLVKRELKPGQPFTPENVPVRLKTKARRVPGWQQETNGLIAEVQPGPVRASGEEEEITLIPMGAARLRVSVFPIYSASGRTWDPNPPMVTTSHPSHYQPPSAMNDGRTGDLSADVSVPWFIWWDAYGQTEWAQYTYSKPRRISKVSVYWAAEDITRNSGRVPHDLRMSQPTDGTVQLPESWRLLNWDGSAWQPIQANYEVAKDRFTVATFQPITTTQLRLEVKQQRGKTAGVIEWKVE